jgi:hypothetical protein
MKDQYRILHRSVHGRDSFEVFFFHPIREAEVSQQLESLAGRVECK